MDFGRIFSALLEQVQQGYLAQPRGRLTYAVASPKTKDYMRCDEDAGRLSLPKKPYNGLTQRKIRMELFLSAIRLVLSSQLSKGSKGSRSMPLSNFVEELEVPGCSYHRMGPLFKVNSWLTVLKMHLDPQKDVFQVGPDPARPHHHLVRLDLSRNLELAKAVQPTSVSRDSAASHLAGRLSRKLTPFENYLVLNAPDDVLRSLNKLAAEVLPKERWADMEDSDEEDRAQDKALQAQEDCLQYQANQASRLGSCFLV